jgi:hypothetical protein
MQKPLLALLGVALVLFGALLPLVLPRHCPVNRAAFERIKRGMSQARVEAILGGPPGDYRTRPTEKVNTMGVVVGYRWLGNEGTATVSFFEGVVRHMSFSEREAEPVDPFEVLLWRLDRLLHLVTTR